MYSKSSHSFEVNKILGGLGALLVAIGSLSLFSGSVGIVGIIGLVLVLIAVKGFSEEYSTYSMYRTAQLGFFLGIVGTVGAVVAFAAFDFFGSLFFNRPIAGILGFLGTIVGWVVVFLFFLGSGILFKVTFDRLSDLSQVGLLRTGALILLIGSILTIIAVGYALLFVGWLLIAIGFFSMRFVTAYARPYAQKPPSYTTSSSGQTKYCPYCGAPNRLDTDYCIHCGRKLPQ